MLEELKLAGGGTTVIGGGMAVSMRRYFAGESSPIVALLARWRTEPALLALPDMTVPPPNPRPIGRCKGDVIAAGKMALLCAGEKKRVDARTVEGESGSDGGTGAVVTIGKGMIGLPV